MEALPAMALKPAELEVYAWDNDSVANYARASVAEIAPKGVPLYRAISGAYFADSEAVYRRHGPGTLAFGEIGSAAAAIWSVRRHQG